MFIATLYVGTEVAIVACLHNIPGKFYLRSYTPQILLSLDRHRQNPQLQFGRNISLWPVLRFYE